MSKKCSRCGEVKVLDDYHNRTASPDGKKPACIVCVNTKAMKVRSDSPDKTRARNLKARFDMSIEQYNVIFLKQKGKCAICHKAESSRDTNGKSKWLSVDHNHDTGAVRGLLCNACNTGIGKLGDSIHILLNAVQYLKKRGSYGEK